MDLASELGRDGRHLGLFEDNVEVADGDERDWDVGEFVERVAVARDGIGEAAEGWFCRDGWRYDEQGRENCGRASWARV
jgi:hypothetical protein